MESLLIPLIHVVIPATAMLYICRSGLMDSVKTEDGLEHYAEEPYSGLPGIMPLNSLINLGYCMFGAAWLFSTYQAVQDGIIQTKDRYYFHVFGWMSLLYGMAQMMRIVTQDHHWAIYDQWVTLPIFSWVLSWAVHICLNTGGVVNIVITLTSMTSYLMALTSPLGFEIALAGHITSAVIVCTLAYVRYPNDGARNAFFLACLSCVGFVVLKLLDLELPAYSSFFKVISGHFLSKICDIFQIHFVAEFFYCILRAKYHEEKRS